MKIIDEWKSIKDFCGYYINHNGEIKSTNAFKGTKEIILKGSVSNKGYKIVNLMNCGKVYSRTIHKLLAQAFIPNPNNLPCINHKDGNKLNNSLDNLEWCDYGYNEKEAYRLKLKKPAWKGKKDIQHPNSKKINQYDLEGNLIKKWNCISTIEKELGISITSICNCCSGRSKKAGNFIWRYANE